MAVGPAAGVPRDRRASTLPALACAAGLALLWLVLAPRTADLAAQVYRANLFHREGFALWDNGWFAGHHVPGYSLVFPPLAALFGPRTIGVASVLVSSALFAHVLRRHADQRRGLAAVWFAFAAAGDLFIGRLTFALGVTCAMACVAALSHRRAGIALLFAMLTAAASPVSGLLLALALTAGARHVPPRRRVVLVGAPLVVAVTMSVLFPEGGTQPYGLGSAAAAAGIAIAVLLALDPRHVGLRRGAALYAAAVAGAYVVPSPMGSNVARLGVLLAGPVLVLGVREGYHRGRLAAITAAIVMWQLWAPVSEAVKADASGATTVAYFQPLIDHLAALPVGRIEVVPTSTRWESVYVAPHAALARGWETQLDRRYNALFYRRRLDPVAYERWLHRLGVSYVALSDAPKERWGRTEAALLAQPPAFLHEVWHAPHWRLFAVRHTRPLVTGGRLTALAPDGFSVAAQRAGTLLVRVRYTTFWAATGGACVSRGPGGFTLLHVTAGGQYDVRARWSIEALAHENACTIVAGRRGPVAGP
jgi:hypothetical protein